MANPPSEAKCDIVRAAATAAQCGMCDAATPPAGCGSPPPPAAVCAVPGAANTRMRLQASRLSPRSLVEGESARFIRAQTEATYEEDLATTAAGLAAAYPTAADVDVSWIDFERCLQDPSGEPSGPNQDVRFSRLDLEGLGFNPPYPLGGLVLTGKVWRNSAKPSFLPVTVDYFINPDLFVVVVAAVLVCAAIASFVSRHLKKEKRQAAAERARACAAAVADLEARGDSAAAAAVAARCAATREG